MAQKYFSEGPSNINNLLQLAALQTQARLQPTLGDKALAVAGSGMSQYLQYRKGVQAMKMQQAMAQEQAAQKQAMYQQEQEMQREQFLVKQGLQPVLPGKEEEIATAGYPVFEMEGGKKYYQVPKETAPKEYTRTWLTKDPAGQEPGWYEQRNVYNRITGKTEPVYTKIGGTPSAAMQREQFVRKQEGELTDVERARLQQLRAAKDKFKDPYTKQVDYAKYNKYLATQKMPPKVKAILEEERMPIDTEAQRVLGEYGITEEVSE